MLSTIDTLQTQRYKQVKSKRSKKYHANNNQKKAKVSILTSNKIHFKTKIGARCKGHFIMTKGPIPQKDITILNVNAYKNRAQNTYSKN